MKRPKNKWKQFRDSKNYHLVNLGRPAIFLLPSKKLNRKFNGTTVKEYLRNFLINNFGAYTSSLISNFGVWKNGKKMIVYDECQEYEVSFVGKEKIPLLLKKITEICLAIEEDCIYFKAGQYACLLYPPKF